VTAPVRTHSTLPAFLALFGSMTTLVCCALPALLVALGMGAVTAGLVTAVPQITVLSANKGWVFAGAGAMLALSGILMWSQRNAPCPADPALARACMQARAVSLWVWLAATVLFAIGAFFAFFAADLLLG
jgi:hypothetical protein